MNHAATLDGKKLDVIGEQFGLKFALDTGGDRVVNLYLHAVPGMWFYRATFSPDSMVDLVSILMEGIDKAAVPAAINAWQPEQKPATPPAPKVDPTTDPDLYGY